MLAPTAIKRLTVANEPARAAVCSGVRPFLLNTNSTQYIVWYNFVKKMNICTYLCEDNPNVVAQNESNYFTLPNSVPGRWVLFKDTVEHVQIAGSSRNVKNTPSI